MAVPDSHNGLKKEVHSYRDEITLSRYSLSRMNFFFLLSMLQTGTSQDYTLLLSHLPQISNKFRDYLMVY